MAARWMLALALVCSVVAQHPDNCKNWCRNDQGQYLCCKHLQTTTPKPVCPVDNRPKGQCTNVGLGGGVGITAVISGPKECYSDSECGSRALCCWDSCLGYRKCTNV